jgi:hypothetical protein
VSHRFRAAPPPPPAAGPASATVLVDRTVALPLRGSEPEVWAPRPPIAKSTVPTTLIRTHGRSEATWRSRRSLRRQAAAYLLRTLIGLVVGGLLASLVLLGAEALGAPIPAARALHAVLHAIVAAGGRIASIGT